MHIKNLPLHWLVFLYLSSPLLTFFILCNLTPKKRFFDLQYHFNILLTTIFPFVSFHYLKFFLLFIFKNKILSYEWIYSILQSIFLLNSFILVSCKTSIPSTYNIKMFQIRILDFHFTVIYILVLVLYTLFFISTLITATWFCYIIYK